jgi:hypothetical protein
MKNQCPSMSGDGKSWKAAVELANPAHDALTLIGTTECSVAHHDVNA